MKLSIANVVYCFRFVDLQFNTKSLGSYQSFISIVIDNEFINRIFPSFIFPFSNEIQNDDDDDDVLGTMR